MEQERELRIEVPEGYEIDREKSTFEVIKFKKVNPNNPTYMDVCKRIFSESISTLDAKKCIISTECYPSTDDYEAMSASDSSQLHKMIAINQLFNIAKYYNGNWNGSVGEKSWYIYYNKKEKRYIVSYFFISSLGIPLFKNYEDACAVADNPNFKEILDAIFIDND